MRTGAIPLNDVLRVIRRRGRLVVLGVVVGLAVAALLSWATPRTYASTTQLFVSTTGSPEDPYNDDLFSQQRVVSYVQVLTSAELAEAVAAELGLSMTPRELGEAITATPLPGTVVLQVVVTDRSAAQAQEIAAAVVEEFSDRVTELETPPGAVGSTVDVQTIQAPDLDTEPVSPLVARNLALGGALGLLIGLSLALLRDRADHSVHTADDVREVTGTEPVALVPENRHLAREHVLSHRDHQSQATEALRAVRLRLQHLDGASHPRVVLVTSALPDDGASTVAVNLAVALTRNGSRVALVDADLRRPRVARYLDLDEDAPGLTDVLAGRVDVGEAGQHWGNGRLTVLTAGPLPQEPDEALGSARMRAVLTALRERHDMVVVDGPPMLSVVDAAAVAPLTDGVLVVARADRTRREHLAEAVDSVGRVHAELLGVVLNRLPRSAALARSGGSVYRADPDRSSAAARRGDEVRPVGHGDASADPVASSTPGPE
ncbi:polysaccharide biosynthesis tyrosine autokinase [Modestobacter italicus]|uniref:polysaccharide biosynthesis tyrosine autokinase n=1 Tax=Modestobacter italicus (strain DSM 44449 / CECT 9708 / BC 501) TaxID=2732864 RepID=UPI0027E07C29|nr:polysaccharide biosynthesis tyrosine autokinase [Modestobacter italicus]